jgi:hypothetical protein
MRAKGGGKGCKVFFAHRQVAHCQADHSEAILWQQAHRGTSSNGFEIGNAVEGKEKVTLVGFGWSLVSVVVVVQLAGDSCH